MSHSFEPSRRSHYILCSEREKRQETKIMENHKKDIHI